MPEKLCLSTFLNIAVHSGSVVVLIYYTMHQCQRYYRARQIAEQVHVNGRRASILLDLDYWFVLMAILLNVGGTAITAMTWQVVAHGHSVAILSSGVVGGVVGSISNVALMPVCASACIASTFRCHVFFFTHVRYCCSALLHQVHGPFPSIQCE
jgi:hypothetical protein